MLLRAKTEACTSTKSHWIDDTEKAASAAFFMGRRAAIPL